MNTRILALETYTKLKNDVKTDILELINNRETERITGGAAVLTSIDDRFGMSVNDIAHKIGFTTFNIPDLEKTEKVLTSLVKDGKIVSYGEERLIKDDSQFLSTYGTEKHLNIVEFLRKK